MRLTDIVVRNLAAPERGQMSYPDDTLAGFSVRVSQGGTKTFCLVYGRDRQRVTLGRYPILGLAEARTEAKRFLAERTLNKFRPPRLKASEALQRFLKEKEGKNRPSTLKITTGVINNHFPKLLLKYLEDIQTDDVTAVTDRLLKKGQLGAAAHAFTAIHTFLRWCVRRRYLQHSPAEALEKPGQNISRERTLTDDEICAVWRATDAMTGHFGAIVKLLMLTGQRRSEIGGLRADYVAGNSICLPSTITKNKRTHTFPIGAASRNILTSNITEGTTLLFPARGRPGQPFNGWSKGKALLDQKAKIAPWTLHDLRRTFATGLQRLGVRIEVIEELLNHVSGTRAGIVGVYQRHRYEEEMRAAVELWESHLQTIQAPA